METKWEKFDAISQIVCKKAEGVSPEECYSKRGKSISVCLHYGKCRIWEKSDEQLNFVLHSFDTNCFLNACAGSGKTEMVGLKAAYGIALWEKTYAGIAVLTFTNNAAAIINERVAHIVGGTGIEYPHFIGTFDSWIHRYVANPFLHLITGYQGKQGDCSIRLVEDRYDAGFLSAFKTKYQYWKTGYVKANEFFLVDPKSKEIVFSSSNDGFDRIRNQNILEDWRIEDLITTKENFWRLGFVTYQDVEYLSHLLLSEDHDASRLLASRFPKIVIDECQDLSWPQLQILQQLLENGTTLHFVGDLNQGIYSFRKVEPEKVKKFTINNNFFELRLTENFRSLQQIVDLSGKIVNQPNITGRKYEGSDPICLCLTYEKTKIENLANSFIDYLIVQKYDLSRSAILTRNNNTVAKLRPGVNSTVKKAIWPAIAIQIWKSPKISSEQRKEALNSLGKFIASTYFNDQPCDSRNQYCPEGVSSRIKWRLFLSNVLGLCCKHGELSNLNLTWKEWAKAFRGVFTQILVECSEKHEITIDLKRASDYSAPKGESDKRVLSTTKTVLNVPSQQIRITNFHQIKGETLDAVMVVSSPTRQGEGYWENWLTDPSSENARFAYVASTRPKSLLIWAIAGNIDHVQTAKLKGLGFVITNSLDSL